MFKRVLIANRGEIAVRIIRACEELDIETVAIFSEADENALHVQLADHAVCVGSADATDSYLNKDSILRAALETGADAIHPGYGFLSEDADFAEQVTAHGITWIGPMPETIRLVGDKDVARASMQPSGIPMAKGSEPLKNNKEAIKMAKEVGYPVILKPVSGGGGKGMYVAHDEDDLKNILDALVDLKKTNYYFEHYIERSRHIEVQIVADNYGEVIHLGERECSIQRRNQKLLEESPSIALTHASRSSTASRKKSRASTSCARRSASLPASRSTSRRLTSTSRAMPSSAASMPRTRTTTSCRRRARSRSCTSRAARASASIRA